VAASPPISDSDSSPTPSEDSLDIDSPLLADEDAELAAVAQALSPEQAEIAKLDAEIQELIIMAGEDRCKTSQEFTLSLGAKSAVTLLHTVNL
jgi:hypothetical protein